MSFTGDQLHTCGLPPLHYIILAELVGGECFLAGDFANLPATPFYIQLMLALPEGPCETCLGWKETEGRHAAPPMLRRTPCPQRAPRGVLLEV